MELWNKNTEIDFFSKSNGFTNPEQLFYQSFDHHWYAYWPKGYKGKKSTLQSRNSLIGNYTEKWSSDILKGYASKKGLYPVIGVVCEDLGLTNKSPADVALCKTQSKYQSAKNIKVLFEVKMSVVWNWELIGNNIKCLGDYTTHQGNPGLLRSDSMLKAIGKSINIRVSGYQSSNIPIIILGNTPITDMYHSKVDHLREAGIIQGFWSLNSNPRDGYPTINKTPKNGFIQMSDYNHLLDSLDLLLKEEMSFFSGMKSKVELGKIIEIANRKHTYESKAQTFFDLVKE